MASSNRRVGGNSGGVAEAPIPTLRDSLRKLDEFGASEVFDHSTGCTLARNQQGDLTLTMERGTKSLTHTLEELLAGPCKGLRGKALSDGIHSVMKALLTSAAASTTSGANESADEPTEEN